MKKNHIMLIVLLLFLGATSCEKDEKNVIESTSEVSCSETLSDGKYLKEIVVTDETGKNQAFYAIYSNDETLLKEFYDSHIFSITINKHDVKSIKNESKAKHLNHEKKGFSEKDYPSVNTNEPDINIILIKYNLEENVNSFTLTVESIASKNFNFSAAIGYTTTEDFIGIVHRCQGYEFLIRMTYRNCWLCFTQDVIKNGQNAWIIDSNPSGFYYDWLSIETWRRSIIVIPHIYQTSINYEIVYDIDNFYSRQYLLGTYDANNYGECYVATAPVGTTPFIWGPNPNDLRFYYHALNGNQCPLPGSWFDGYSCFVVAIPVGADPYLWNRNMLVKSQRII